MALDDLPQWREVETVEDFVIATKDALIYWLLCHTDPEVWADQWLVGESAEWAFSEMGGELSNDYFHFDWKSAAYEAMAKATTANLCSVCGAMALDYDDMWCDCQSDYENDPDFYDEPELLTPSDDEIAEYMQETEFPLSEDALLTALETKGFRTYSEHLEGYISGHVDEMTEAVEGLEDAIYHDNRWDMLTLAREATRIYHVNGDVIRDYGENIGLNYDLVDNVRNDGFAEVFGREAVREFLEG